MKQENPDNVLAAYDLLLEQLDAEMAVLDKEARELTSKADAIEDAVYDLKAVNPNAVSEKDTRTPEQLIAEIEEHNNSLLLALHSLKQLL